MSRKPLILETIYVKRTSSEYYVELSQFPRIRDETCYGKTKEEAIGAWILKNADVLGLDICFGIR